jgi:hypothetical protein
MEERFRPPCIHPPVFLAGPSARPPEALGAAAVPSRGVALHPPQGGRLWAVPRDRVHTGPDAGGRLAVQHGRYVSVNTYQEVRNG